MAMLGKIKAFIVHVPNCNVLLFMHCTLNVVLYLPSIGYKKPSFLFKVLVVRGTTIAYTVTG